MGPEEIQNRNWQGRQDSNPRPFGRLRAGSAVLEFVTARLWPSLSVGLRIQERGLSGEFVHCRLLSSAQVAVSVAVRTGSQIGFL